MALCSQWALCNLSYYRHDNLGTRLWNQQTQWSRLLRQNAILFKLVKKIPLSLWTSKFCHRCRQASVTSVCPEPDESNAHTLISSPWQLRIPGGDPTFIFPSYVALCSYVFFLACHMACLCHCPSFGYPKYMWCGPGSSVGIATDYGLDGPGPRHPLHPLKDSPRLAVTLCRVWYKETSKEQWVNLLKLQRVRTNKYIVLQKKNFRVGTRFSARPDRPWGPPSLLYNRYRVFPGGKVRPWRAADHSPPSSAAVVEE